MLVNAERPKDATALARAVMAAAARVDIAEGAGVAVVRAAEPPPIAWRTCNRTTSRCCCNA